MKSHSRTLTTAAALAVFTGLGPTLNAQSIWNGTNNISANTNWSSAANWLPSSVPGASTSVVFTTNGAASSAGTINNVVDAGFVAGGGTIGSLQYANTNGFHTTLIAPGQTLTIAGGLMVGTGTDAGSAQTLVANITGPGGALVMNNTSSNLFVNQASSSAGAHLATLNMSNLDNLTGNLGRVMVGVASGVNRAEGVLYLARTNLITLSGSSPQLYLGFNNGNNNANNNLPQLYLGYSNAFFVNSITVGADKQQTLMSFNPAVVSNNPTAYFRGSAGAGSRVSSWILGNNSGQTTTSSQSLGTNDFSGGILDAMVDTMTLGESEHGSGATSGSGTGVFTFQAGTNNINTLYLGYRLATAGNSVGNGTMNVNGTGTLVVNNAICLSFWSGGNSVFGSGTLNINGGTVLANTITNGVTLAGANNQANINVTGGTLGITSILGVAGTLSSPLLNFAPSDSVLQLQISGAQTNIETVTFTPSGTTNVVNVTYLPPISGYPVEFPLVGFQTLGGALNFGISNMPPANPPYQGYITNDSQTVYLILTNGPTLGSQLDIWTGAASGNWDSASLNWKYLGTPTTFANGVPVQFDDTAVGPTAIKLTGTVLPASVTVSNNSLSYALGGPGKLSGSDDLTKDGSGTLLITNSGINDFVGTITINGGVVQFGAGGTDGVLPASDNVTDDGTLIFDRGDNITVPNLISGGGSLVQSGGDVITITASNSFSGTTLVNSGTLLLNGVLSGALSNAPGTTLGGTGTNAGQVSISGTVQPSAVTGAPSTLAVGPLTMYVGGTAQFNLDGANATAGGGINDLLQVGGDVTPNGSTILLNFLGVPQPGLTYTLFSFSGNLNGGFNPIVAGTHFASTLNQSTPNAILLTLSGSGANLKWNSTSNTAWNVGGNSNWLNEASSMNDVFYSGDTVLLDDTVGLTNSITLAAGVTVFPGAITNNSSTRNYTISGTGQISGSGSIAKQGASTLTLGTPNGNFTGTISVEGGTLRAGNNAALGSASTTVSNGATLDINGFAYISGQATVTISGSGVGGNGALVNNGADQQAGLQNLALAGDATVGGSGRFDIRQSGANACTLTSADATPHNLTVVGPNHFNLVTVTIGANIADVDVKGGAFGLQVNTLANSSSWANDATRSITVESNAELSFFNTGTAFPLGRGLILENGATLYSESGANAISGLISLQGNATVQVDPAGTAPILALNNTISGPGALTKTGTGVLALSGTNTYTGGTFVNSGTLSLNDPGSLAGTPMILIAGGAMFSVAGHADGTLTLASGQTAQGNGAVDGSVVVGPSATISAGTNSSSTGILTITNALTLGGNALLKINQAAGTNDLIQAANITNGGTLTVTNVSATPLQAGDSFKLFNAQSYSGVFNGIVPATPGSGLGWNTNNLATSGVLSVVSVVVPQPRITGVSFSGGNIIFSGSNGSPGANYYVLQSTNVTLPRSSWTIVATNQFDPIGNFSVTNMVNSAKPELFYSLVVPSQIGEAVAPAF